MFPPPPLPAYHPLAHFLTLRDRHRCRGSRPAPLVRALWPLRCVCVCVRARACVCMSRCLIERGGGREGGSLRRERIDGLAALGISNAANVRDTTTVTLNLDLLPLSSPPLHPPSTSLLPPSQSSARRRSARTPRKPDLWGRRTPAETGLSNPLPGTLALRSLARAGSAPTKLPTPSLAPALRHEPPPGTSPPPPADARSPSRPASCQAPAAEQRKRSSRVRYVFAGR